MPTVRHWPWRSKETDLKVSYILDALRKSDAQRRLGQPPDLNTPGAPSAPAQRAGSRRWLPMLALSAIVVVLVAVVLAGRGFAPVQQWLAGSERAAPAEQPGDPEPAPLPPGELELTETVADAALEEEEPSRAESSPAPAEPPITVMSRPAPERARDRPAPARDRPAPEPERERLVEQARQAQPVVEAAPITVMPETVPEPAPDSALASLTPPAEESLEPWTPERSEFMRQWELPLSVRRDLPDLRLSIHVFSPQPQDRFVLINGERRIEGDDLGRGVSLVEIRRDGALVRFREYSFLLEP